MGIYQNGQMKEQPLYGSSRLGEYRGGRKEGQLRLGLKMYELSNHLGNILAVITLETDNRMTLFALLICLTTNYVDHSCDIIRSVMFQVDTVKLVNSIDAEVKRVNSQTRSYTKATEDFSGASSEGGQADFYYDKKVLKKIVAVQFGEMGKVSNEYFIDSSNHVYCILSTQTMYDKPMYEKGSKVASVEKNKFYFHDNRLIRWDSSGKVINADFDAFKAKESELLNSEIFKN